MSNHVSLRCIFVGVKIWLYSVPTRVTRAVQFSISAERAFHYILGVILSPTRNIPLFPLCSTWIALSRLFYFPQHWHWPLHGQGWGGSEENEVKMIFFFFESKCLFPVFSWAVTLFCLQRFKVGQMFLNVAEKIFYLASIKLLHICAVHGRWL